jgi:hypothetical protein
MATNAVHSQRNKDPANRRQGESWDARHQRGAEVFGSGQWAVGSGQWAVGTERAGQPLAASGREQNWPMLSRGLRNTTHPSI